MSTGMRVALVGLLVVPCVACDQATKVIAAYTLESGPVEFLNGIVQFRLVHNTGAFLSLGSQLPDFARALIFLGLVPIALAIAVIVLMRSMEPTRAAIVGGSLIMGGGIGNLIDRILNDGAVVDFVSIGVSGLRTGIFNVADVSIIAGVIVMMWELRRGSSGLSDSEPNPPPQSPSR